MTQTIQPRVSVHGSSREKDSHSLALDPRDLASRVSEIEGKQQWFPHNLSLLPHKAAGGGRHNANCCEKDHDGCRISMLR